MSERMFLELQQKPAQNIKQLQRLIMSRQMQQAIHLLQIPVMELSPLVEMEVEGNPVLEYSDASGDEEGNERIEQVEDESSEDPENSDTVPEMELNFSDGDLEILQRLDQDFRDHFSQSGAATGRSSVEEEELRTFLESSITANETLFEHLMRQAQEVFDTPKQLAIAEALIGNFDGNGFFTTSLTEIATLEKCMPSDVEKVLQVIQTFHPCGVGARNLQESLLIQLKEQKKEGTLAYQIVEGHFDDLLHNRIGVIKKALKCSVERIGEAVDKDIAKLDLHPGMKISHQAVAYIIPDVSVKEDGDTYIVGVNEDTVPPLRLNRRYLRMLEDEALPKETKEFIRQKVLSAKWLLRNILQRNTTIEKIAEELVKRQRAYFADPNGKLVPLTMRDVAQELELHESTIARAVANKYIDTPRGVLPLRAFFTNAIGSDQGDLISAQTARDLLKEIVDKEDKNNPLSDEALSDLMKKRGIVCARRTVAKYRSALKIGTAQQRRKFHS